MTKNKTMTKNKVKSSDRESSSKLGTSPASLVTKKVILVIMDGWGVGKPDKYNAIDNAQKPNYDKLARNYPNTSLKSDGLSVGLPEGQMGTSEVNHLTIGAGRVILQDLPRINSSIESGEFYNNETLVDLLQNCEKNSSNMHLIGILSDGGLHSHINHLSAIFEFLSKHQFKNNIFVHCFADGRDVPPKSAEKYFTWLDEQIKKYNNIKISLATAQGRLYLDRDKDWSKTKLAVDLIIDAGGRRFTNWQAIINYEYNQNNKDEFFSQYVVGDYPGIADGDSLFMFHYRTDRMYQLLKSLFEEIGTKSKIGAFVSPSEEFTKLLVAFPRLKVTNTMSEAISKAGKKQIHIAETEKFQHLTYFLNGEQEQEFDGEKWEMIESNRFVKPQYNYEPSMRNFDLTKKVINAIENDEYDFIAINYSSTDMVGHTGNYNAAVIATESVDYCLGKIYEAIEGKLDKYALIITADHGNADEMWDYKNNQPHTQHTLNPVPFIVVIDIKCTLDRRESLEDVAPTILDLMGISKPQVMTGTSLILRE